MPKISVLVPVYNVENYLRECLDSIINQTLEDIEIICINDGSTDSSADILMEYQNKDKRLKIINKENSGYGASMNQGLEAASGEYIGIVESDDFIKNTMFEDLYNLAKTNDLDMVKSDFKYYISSKKQARTAGIIKRKYTGKVFCIKEAPILVKMMPSIWSAIYKRDFLNKNKIRFLETPGASYQDTSFAFKTITSAKRIMLTNKAYLNYRIDNSNSSVKSKGKVYAICDEWNEITRYLNERKDLKEVINCYKLSTQFNGYKWNLLRIDPSYRKDFIEVFQTTFSEFYKNGEIGKNFYKKVKKSELDLLLKDKTKFETYINKLAIKEEEKNKRRKLFSIRINSSRVSIVLFGKQIVRFEYA